MRNQCHFAQSTRALVSIQHLVENFFAAACLCLDNASTLKANRDILDQCALMRQRLGARHITFYAQSVGCSEHFFRRNVRIAGNAVLGR